MLRVLKVAASLVVLLGAWTYSWTFTPHGRLDYPAAVIARLARMDPGPIDFSEEARLQANSMVAMSLPYDAPAPLAEIRDHQIERPDGTSLPLRVYRPEGDGPLPMYLDIHGGGWWMGDGFPFDRMTTHLAAMSGAIIVSVDYRLSPQHAYPAALDDCSAALSWMHANAGTLGGDPERIAIGGGSAGGNLAAALAIRNRDEKGPDLAFQYLLVPATDLSGARAWPSYEEMADDYMLKVSGIREMIDAYVPNPGQRTHPWVSPLLAEDLSGLPPALVVTNTFDPLRDMGEAYAAALEAAGIPVTLHREQALHGMVGSPERSMRVQKMAAEALRAALS